MGNFCEKNTETTLHEICVQVFLRFSDSSKPSQSVLLIYELGWLAGFHKSKENLLKTSCMVVPVTKVAHIFWRHDNRKQLANACKHWCDVSCDIPYWPEKLSSIWPRECILIINQETLPGHFLDQFRDYIKTVMHSNDIAKHQISYMNNECSGTVDSVLVTVETR